ncbi:hypothetical protein ACN38_g4829 [Penicillium nordicum]|uniref:Zn(2)-C6 fungal-type domain-containing protein n=1 Tax=Penicillium nordicum TaxID=229535 RepID=A0A0M8PBF7_9EURO|nr:hypothetical protein ACN38_g4829 [Penicillium nordicum]
MPRDDKFSRSRTGCLQCRKKHNKCDEQQPICSFCASRDLDCQYSSGVKWVRPKEPMPTRHKPRKDTRRAIAQNIGRPSALFAQTCFESAEDKSAWEYCTWLHAI